MGVPVIVVTGPVGAGKSTTVDAVTDALNALGVRVWAVDQDYLRSVYPHPEGDSFGAELGYRNLAACWSKVRDVGVGAVVIADVVEDAAQRDRYAKALDAAASDVTVVRLDVPMRELERRLVQRESPESLAWHLERAPELQAIMERNEIGDVVIDVGDRSIDDVAEEIIRRTRLGLGRSTS